MGWSRRRHSFGSPATGHWKTSSEVAYFICEFLLLAAPCAQAIRYHRAIENRSHYVRDGSFRETPVRAFLRATFSVPTASRTCATLAIASPSVASTLCARYASCRER